MRWLFVLFLTVGWASQAGALSFSTFDSGLDGWTGADIRFVVSIGNPAGALEFQETYRANATYALAPAKFLGDWSALDGTGDISYDHRVPLLFSPGFYGAAVEREIRLAGPGGAATWIGSLPAFNSSFVTVTAPLSESAWTVTSGTWQGLLANVTSFELRVDHYNDLFGAERTQFDNIRVAEPSASVLLVAFAALQGRRLERRFVRRRA